MNFGDVATGVATGGLYPLAKALQGNKTLPTYNIQPATDQINKSADTQNGIVGNTFGKLQGLNAPYMQGVTGAGQGYQSQSGQLGQDYLKGVGSASDQLGSNLSTALMQRTMAAQPAIQNSLRESLAATGGLQRGGADQAFAQQAAQTAQNLYNGNQDIVNQQLAARQNAMGQVYGNQNNALGQVYGNNLNAQGQVFNASRGDIDQMGANQLGIEQGRNNSLLNLLGVQQNSNIASVAADNQSKNALLAALLSAGGTAAGAAFGAPRPGAVPAPAPVQGPGVRGTTLQIA